MPRYVYYVLIMLFVTTLAGIAGGKPGEKVPLYSYKIVNIYPHDTGAFTQGLVYADGVLYEGTGQKGESSIRKVDIKTGTVLQFHQLPSQYFGEGVAVYGDRIVQLTWQSNTGFIYDRNSFLPMEQFYYASEGWGLTHDGERLIMSDGTSMIYFLDPLTFEEIGSLKVQDDGKPVEHLNELEFINGEVYANVWPGDSIVIFSPQSGAVTGWIDLSGLLNSRERQARTDVLNGIAYDAENRRLFVTGKYWPKLFEIELVRKD
ncbi:MAG: glutaminyl-peptide cyclotransferase [Calditrichae bacterium]|nr:glutaminyl-peptide cyclotransferase [Calditrichia bacterium]